MDPLPRKTRRRDWSLELRAAGCVFAEDEAALLVEAADDAASSSSSRRSGWRATRSSTLIGWVDFGGLRLSVGPGVFVPRQRTLRLVARLAAVEAATRGTGQPCSSSAAGSRRSQRQSKRQPSARR